MQTTCILALRFKQFPSTTHSFLVTQCICRSMHGEGRDFRNSPFALCMHPRPHAAPPAPGERAREVRGADIPTKRGDDLAERTPQVRGADISTEKGDALVDRAPKNRGTAIPSGRGMDQWREPLREGDRHPAREVGCTGTTPQQRRAMQRRHKAFGT